MIEQSQIIFPIDKINERVEFKMNRLNERLKEEKLIEEESNEATKQKL